MDIHDIAKVALGHTIPARLVGGGTTWRVNLREQTATHESGLVLTFVQRPHTDQGSKLAAELTSVDLCWVPDGYPIWTVLADPAGVAETLRILNVTDERQAASVIAAFATDAGKAWVRAVRDDEEKPALRKFCAVPDDAQALALQGK